MLPPPPPTPNNSVQLVVATMFKRFRVSLPEQQRVQLEIKIIMRPKDGKLLVQLERR